MEDIIPLGKLFDFNTTDIELIIENSKNDLNKIKSRIIKCFIKKDKVMQTMLAIGVFLNNFHLDIKTLSNISLNKSFANSTVNWKYILLPGKSLLSVCFLRLRAFP